MVTTIVPCKECHEHPCTCTGWCDNPEKAFDLGCKKLGVEDWCGDKLNCPLIKYKDEGDVDGKT